MTDKLPPNLLVLFQPRPPLRYLPPCDIAPGERRTPVVSGVAQYLEELRKPDPDYVPTETLQQQRENHRENKKKAHQAKLEEGIKKCRYDPTHDVHIRGDPFRTLFVARLSYEVTQQDLEREFGRFGPIERIRLVKDKNSNKPRGYAFILYERDKDMKAAFKETDGLRIKDRRIVVDVERGRTTKGWKPRRLGGGLGG
ncbi:RNA-binding domain-containing protein, partial [Ascobolus immersus RN42]